MRSNHCAGSVAARWERSRSKNCRTSLVMNAGGVVRDEHRAVRDANWSQRCPDWEHCPRRRETVRQTSGPYLI